MQIYLGILLSYFSRISNLLRLLLSIGLVLSYLYFPKTGYDSGSDILSHVFYMFSHANIWHLMANIVCIWMVRCPFHLCGALLAGVVCSFVPSFCSSLTYGFSGVLFAVVGISWGEVGRFRDMLWRNKWYFLIPFVLPHVNGFLHLYCALLGYLLGYCVYWKKFSKSELL